MALNSQKYRDALARLGPQRAEFIAPSAVFRDWLLERKVPTDLAQFLLENALAGDVPFPNGCGGVWTPDDIMALNDQESAILAAGLFSIGSAINGDLIVIDLRDPNRQSGFLSHDELWDNPPDDARMIFIPVAESIHEMLKNVSDALWQYLRHDSAASSYPIDYFDAARRLKDGRKWR